MIWKEFYPPPCNKLVIYYNGAVVMMKRFDGKGRTILFDPYGPPRDYWPKNPQNPVGKEAPQAC